MPDSQSYQRGIETNLIVSSYKEQYPLNRTNVELKLRCILDIEQFLRSLNRTNVELKRL